ncbi:FAD dependent oxidoreductase [Aspergillus recurvatus]
MTECFSNAFGETEPVWVHHLPYSEHPRFPSLDHNIETEVCIIGSGIAGISTAYELITRGRKVTLLEARHVLSGESSRTSGHLSNALDDGYINITKKHGTHGAKLAAESHTWAIDRIAHITRTLDLDCEFRYVPAYKVPKFLPGDLKHEADIKKISKEADFARDAGIDAIFEKGLGMSGWDGDASQRDAAVFPAQATFHPTKYLLGVLEWLKEHPNFQCFASTRVTGFEEEKSKAIVLTEQGYTVIARDVVEATCIPMHDLNMSVEMSYFRTYCVAIRVPKGSVEDCLIYDTDDPYKYVRLTACDDKNDYLVIGGCDHEVGQEISPRRFEVLESWVRQRFTHAGAVDYRWSGQIIEPVDHLAFIGKAWRSHTYVVTGDSGNGLTHGVLAGRLIADEIEGEENSWAVLYNPSRMTSISKAL